MFFPQTMSIDRLFTESSINLPYVSFPIDDNQTGGWGKFTGLESKQIRRAFVRKVCYLLR